jgi:hypothetical protein
LGLVVVAVATLAAIFYYQNTTSVYFVRFYPDAMYLDNAQPIALAGEKTDQSRQVITAIRRGKHIVHYEVTNADRYYAELAVNRGINNIELKFKELRLPSLLTRLDLTESKQALKNETFNYQLYGHNGEIIPYTAELTLQLNSEADSVSNDQFAGTLKLNNKVYDIALQYLSHKLSDKEAKHFAPVLVYQDDYHAYYYKYYLYKSTFEFEFYAVFKPVLAAK